MHTRKITNPIVPVQDFIGRRFGRLVVVSFLGSRPHPHAKYRAKSKARFWECLCDCGQIVEHHTSALNSGNVRSCGCLRRDQRYISKNKKHGMTNIPEHNVWSQMLMRCHNTDHHAYELYGGRGILVCEQWQNSFATFIADMGRRPSPKHTLDRIDNNLGYSPENCRWATWREQSQNKRTNQFLTFQGQTLCIAEWERRLGFSSGLIRYRQKRGFSLENIMTTPPETRPTKAITYDGKTHCAAEWERLVGLKPGTLKYRLKAGWSIEQALTIPAGIHPADPLTGRFLKKTKDAPS